MRIHMIFCTLSKCTKLISLFNFFGCCGIHSKPPRKFEYFYLTLKKKKNFFPLRVDCL
ncbi:hypothetical protein CC78DRAFT_528838, partial [Lojkania enalia]